MPSIGDRLRSERLRRGLDIDQLAEQTKINAAMLEAIEADDLDRLPGSFFTRSFVRQYAKALELDDDEFEAELQRVTGGAETVSSELPAASPALDLPPVTPGVGSRGRKHHSLSSLIAFVLIVAACSVIYTYWQKSRTAARTETPSGTAAQRRETAPKPAAQAPPPAAQPVTTAPAETPAPQSPAPEGAAPPAQAGPISVQVHASAEAWIRVTADGVRVFAGTLEPNQSRSFDGKQRMSILFGDPGAVEVTWNGKPVGAIGPRGKPRAVHFTPEAFQVFSPAPPTPPAEFPEP